MNGTAPVGILCAFFITSIGINQNQNHTRYKSTNDNVKQHKYTSINLVNQAQTCTKEALETNNVALKKLIVLLFVNNWKQLALVTENKWFIRILPNGRGGRGRPREARLQFALLPSIIGVGSTQAFLADSGSRKVT